MLPGVAMLDGGPLREDGVVVPEALALEEAVAEVGVAARLAGAFAFVVLGGGPWCCW